MIRAIALALFVMFFCAPANADKAPDTGLMWNRTGLPAVFPLQVQSPPGQQYYLVLSDADTGAPALAAFFVGGQFFKVLTPPGMYDIQIYAGDHWHDETQLFGRGALTEVIRLPTPLTFSILDDRTKGGHLIKLTRDSNGALSDVAVSDQHICQRWALQRAPRPQAPFYDSEGYATRLTTDGELVQHPDAGFDPERSSSFREPIVPTDHASYFSGAEFAVRQVPC